MSKFTVYNILGKEVGTVDQPVLFETSIDEKLIHRYVLWVRSMLRHTVAHTKTRGEVRGGGKKPWKQKGTGRARIGSIRAPHWRGGGITFGPLSTQTWETRMPRGERRKAFFSALAAKAQSNNIIILDAWDMTAPKTKDVVSVLMALPIETTQKVLHVNGVFDEVLFKSTSNLQGIDSKTVAEMNVLDVMNHDKILMTQDTLTTLQNHFTPTV